MSGSLICCMLLAGMPPAAAQSYPTKPMRIVVPFTPGGPYDILARLIGQKLAEAWGQQVLVDNRPGGGTVIGSEYVARSPADGYTMLMVAPAPLPTLEARCCPWKAKSG